MPKTSNDEREAIPIVHVVDQATQMDTQSLACLFNFQISLFSFFLIFRSLNHIVL